jgi:exopolyphosphatase / guanosine-5'-triphosphate,3'-diphosphate pyrophosphatase
MTRRAVIDVGTNSVKLLVADIAGRRAEPVHESSEQTRLGRDFYPEHRLQSAAITRTARAVASFVEKAREAGAGVIRIIATSAAREALNQDELLAALQSASALPVEVISGEQEAEWTFQGVVSNRCFAGGPLLIADVGGGSTELILGAEDSERFCHSFPLGTVRLLEQAPHSDPPTGMEWDRCQAAVTDFLARSVHPVIAGELSRFAPESVQLVGTGGTTSILARVELGLASFDRDRIEALRMNRGQISRQRERLWSLPLDQRMRIPGLPADRADVILTGVAIYEALMRLLAFDVLRVSTRGLRFAALLDPAPPGMGR